MITAYSSDSVSRPPFGVGLPGSLTLALPLVAVPLLVMMTRRWNVTPQVARWLAVRTALLLTLAMVPLAGWIAPRAHLGWRESVVGHELPHSLRQMTLTELWAGSYGSSAGQFGGTKARGQQSALDDPDAHQPERPRPGGGAARRRHASATIARAIGGATLWWITSAVPLVRVVAGDRCAAARHGLRHLCLDSSCPLGTASWHCCS